MRRVIVMMIAEGRRRRDVEELMGWSLGVWVSTIMGMARANYWAFRCACG